MINQYIYMYIVTIYKYKNNNSDINEIINSDMNK